MRTGPALVSDSRTHVLYTTCLLYCLLTLAHFCASVIPAAVSGRAEQPLVSHNNNMGFADKEKFIDIMCTMPAAVYAIEWSTKIVRAVLAAVAREQFVGSYFSSTVCA